MKKMRKQLYKLLSIHGISGQEQNVRKYLQPIMETQMDTVEIDAYGNLLSTKKIGNGEGATVLLSAHMDTVRGVQKDRKLLENNGVITSDFGALGADDRAGIAIILEVLRQMDKLRFNGTLKIAFSREEEIGCVGSSHIDSKWYEDVDLAIVVDRRGNRDIVVGTCGQPFCCDAVGNFFEEVSKMQGMDWKAVEGGISDALTFSESGINSVNLSAGYENEHTAKEYVVIADMWDTVKLILQAFGVINDFYHTFTDVPKVNQWIDDYGYGSYYSSKGVDLSKSVTQGYYEDAFGVDYVYAEEFDKNGDVYLYEIGANVTIQQGDQEIILSRDSLKSIMKQLKGKL